MALPTDVLKQDEENEDNIAWLVRLHKIAVDPATDPKIREKTVAILLTEMPGILSEACSGRLSEEEHDWEEYGGPRLEGM